MLGVATVTVSILHYRCPVVGVVSVHTVLTQDALLITTFSPATITQRLVFVAHCRTLWKVTLLFLLEMVPVTV